MNMLRASCLLFSFALFAPIAPLLAGCPDGAGIGVPGQDGGGDALEDGATDGSSAATDGDAPDAPPESAAPIGSGALCGANGRNDCGPFLLCEESLGCVECRDDVDCPVAAAHCLQGTCVGCRPGTSSADGGSPDCPAGARTCWSSDDECHAPCSDTNQCPAGTACDKASGECVSCNVDADCSSGVCSPAQHRCVECTSDATCPAARPRCRTLTGTCHACTSNADCGHASPICDPLTFTCRVGCSSDTQCPGQQCDAATAKCVASPADAGSSDASAAVDAH
ncbi:MAG: putative lipoprotein [Labilithrix sp.]|nr:putative lipoprotein [Labilithrix sp.]